MRPASEEVPTDSAARGPNLDRRSHTPMGEGPLLIVAGPGTGKTRTLGRDCAHCCAPAPPRRMRSPAITSRARQRPSCSFASRSFWCARRRRSVQTFHALGLDLLRAHASCRWMPPDFAILDEADSASAARAGTRGVGVVRPSVARPNAISSAKAALVALRSAAPELAAIYSGVPKRLWPSRRGGFDDLLVRAVRLLETDRAALAFARGRCRHLLVTSIRTSMRPNTVWCACWRHRDRPLTCAQLAIPIRRSTFSRLRPSYFAPFAGL